MIRIRPLQDLVEDESATLHVPQLKSENTGQSGNSINSVEKCLFCLKPAQRRVKNQEKRQWHSHLRKICTYLDIEFAELRLDERNSSTGNHGASKGEEITVPFCSDCAVVTSELSNHCAQLEVTHMWIDHFLKKLTEILTITAEISGSSGNDEELKEISRVKVLRERAKEICLSNSENDIRTKHDTSRRQDVPERPKQSRKSKYQPPPRCQICYTTHLDSQELQFHMINCHPEKLLSSTKIPRVSNEMFQNLCHQLLQKMTNVEIVNEKMTCLYCPSSFSDQKFLKSHIVDSHIYIFTRKLEILQNKCKNIQIPHVRNEDGGDVLNFVQQLKTTPVSSQQLIIASKPKSKASSSCHFCQRKFNSRSNMKKHILYVHREQVMLKLPDCSVPLTTALNLLRVKQFRRRSCVVCGKVVKDLRMHRQLCKGRAQQDANITAEKKIAVPSESENAAHVTHSSTISDNASGKESIPRDMISWECTECGHLFPTTDALEEHAKVGCSKETGTNKLRQFACPRCGAGYYHATSLRRHMNICRKEDGKRKEDLQPRILYKCCHCGKQLTRKYLLNKHIQRCKAISKANDVMATNDSTVLLNSTKEQSVNDIMEVVTVTPTLHHLQTRPANTGGSGRRKTPHTTRMVFENTIDQIYFDEGIEDELMPDHDPLQM